MLILHSNQSVLPATILLDSSIRQEMQSQLRGRLELFSEFLDLERFPELDRDEVMASFLREKYAKLPIDLLIVTGPQALIFLVQRRVSLFVNTPIVFAGIREESELLRSLPSGVTGLTMHLNPVPTVELALHLQPDARHLVVVTGAAEFDRHWEEMARRALHSYEGRLQVSYLAGLSMAELSHELGQLPPDTIVLLLSFFRDATGQALIARDVAKELAEGATAPAYAPYETYLGRGIVGGYMDTFEALGAATARLGLRVLAGEKPDTLPPGPEAAGAYIVDWRQLQRWGISESRLPAGSEIRFRLPTAWEQYSWQIMFITAALLGEASLIAGLLYQRRGRQRAELETRRRGVELAHMNRRAVAGEMSASIAHEVNQPLTAILSNAEALHELLGQENFDLEKSREIVTDIIDEDTRASEVIDRIRKFLRKDEIKSDLLDLNELVESALHLLHGEIVKRKIKVETALTETLPAIAGDPVQLQQVLLNLIINAMDAVGSKTPARRKIIISTHANGKHVEAVIVDFGHGITADNQRRVFEPFFTTKEHGLGLGLSICSTIVKAHGGKLSIDNNDQGGATVVLCFSTHGALAPA